MYTISYNINKIPEIKDAIENKTAVDDVEIKWQITVKDKAGNQSVTDADDKTEGLQMMTLNVNSNPPVLIGAFVRRQLGRLEG